MDDHHGTYEAVRIGPQDHVLFNTLFALSIRPQGMADENPPYLGAERAWLP